MSKSLRKFDRWTCVKTSTWPLQVFNKYDDELNEMIWSNLATTKQTFKYLKNKGAKHVDRASDHFEFEVPKGEEVFKNIKAWADTYNKFLNWVNLNSLLALSSNFETYLSTVVSLALESDPGLLFDSPKSIDGIALLKKGGKRNKFHEDIITSLTKGDWNMRLSAFKKTFGSAPAQLTSNVSDLEKIRKLRNKIGHAFGRDIDASRNHEVKTVIAMERLTEKKLKDFRYKILSTAKGIDKFLLKNHIGDFQGIALYHRIYPSLRKDVHPSERAMIFKKRIGQFGDTSGKEYCKELVKYYEGL
jgi:hypothetical protein